MQQASATGEYEPLSAHEPEDADLHAAIAAKTLDGNALWEEFERVENPAVAYDFAEPGDAPWVTSVVGFVSVTTFLAGFAVAELGGFSTQDWVEADPHGATMSYIYICLMAWVTASTLWMSVVGIFTAAVYYRSKNQMYQWAGVCKLAVQPITEALSKGDGRKGRRQALYRHAMLQVARKNHDWANTLTLSGGKLHVHAFPDGDIRTWVVKCWGPPEACNHLLRELFHSTMFPVSIVMYIGAQALKALRGVPQGVAVCVALILSTWVCRMVVNLRRIYTKMND